MEHTHFIYGKAESDRLMFLLSADTDPIKAMNHGFTVKTLPGGIVAYASMSVTHGFTTLDTEYY